MRIHPRRPRDRLFQPGTRADVGQAGDMGDRRRVQPLIGHGDGDQHRRLGPQAEGCHHLLRVAAVGDGEPRHAPGLLPRHPALKRLQIRPRRLLVGRDDQQLAQPRTVAPRRQLQLRPPFRPVLPAGAVGLAQHRLGEAGAQRGEQGVARVLPRLRQRIDPAVGALRIQPGGRAVHRAEGDGQDRLLGQRLPAGIADHRPARRLEVDFPHLAGSLRRAVGQPQDRTAVGALQRPAHQQPGRRILQKRQDRPAPGGFLLHRRHAVGVEHRREMVQLVHRQQVAVTAELLQMQVRRGGDRLICRDVALQAAAEVAPVLRRAQGEIVSQHLAPARIDEGFLRLLAQAVARHDPAHPVDPPRLVQRRRHDDRQQRFPPAGRHRRQNVANLRLLLADGIGDGADQLLMGSQLRHSTCSRCGAREEQA